MQSNNSPIKGKAAIVQFLSGYWKTFASLEHDLLNISRTVWRSQFRNCLVDDVKARLQFSSRVALNPVLHTHLAHL